MVIAPDEPSDIELIDYENATVYGDLEQEQVLHRGAVRVLPTGGSRCPVMTDFYLPERSIISIRSLDGSPSKR